MPDGVRHHGPQIGYWARLVGLTLWGPAQLGTGNDPVEQLRRDYGRPHRAARPRSSPHGPEWVRLTSAAVTWSSDSGPEAEAFDHRLHLDDRTTR